jgi:hypothetical protein
MRAHRKSPAGGILRITGEAQQGDGNGARDSAYACVRLPAQNVQIVNIANNAAGLTHIIVVEPARRRSLRAGPDVFDVRLAGADRVVLTSREPFFAAARFLIAEDIAAPTDCLIMKYVGSDVDALRAVVGAAAALAVREGVSESPRLVRWKAHSFRNAPPWSDEKQRAATLCRMAASASAVAGAA